jgi:hypothetical protein
MRTIILLSITAMLCGVLGATPADGRAWYVASGATGARTGTAANPFDNIQAGLDAAAVGDTVILADGTYTGTGNREISFSGRRGVVLRSASDDPARCVINCQSQGGTVIWGGFWFHSNQDSTSVIRGVKLINGHAMFGGGVLCEASPKLVKCVLANCVGDVAGGGVRCVGGSPIFEDCVFVSNSATSGGGVDVVAASPVFRRCTFDNNGGALGGAIAFTNCVTAPVVANCTLVGNRASYGGGAVSVSGSVVLIQSCTFVDNCGPGGSGIYADNGATPLVSRSIIAFGVDGAAIRCVSGAAVTVTCSDISGNEGGDYVGCLDGRLGIDGNIQVDPQFCDAVRGNYGVWAASACSAAFAGECGQIGVAAPACGLSSAAFTNVTAGALAGGDHGHGVAVGDYDVDGDDDLYVVNDGTPNRLLRNDGGGAFAEATPTVLADAGHGRAAAWADIDNDGNLDLYLVKDNQANRLFRNQGADGFVDMTIAPADDAGAGRAVNWVDYNLDGKLDLYIVNEGGGNRLLRGVGTLGSPFWFFGDAGIVCVNDTGSSVAAAWGDVDNDGDPDLYLSRTFQSKMLLRNVSAVGFEDATSRPLDDRTAGAGVAWGDFNNDGRLDLYAANRNTPDKLFRQTPAGFTVVTGGAFGQLRQSTSAAWADFDNDGDLDLFLGRSPGSDALLRNDGGDAFTELSLAMSGLETPTTGAAWLDFDSDGDLDLYIVRDGAPNALLRNDAAAGNHWLQLVLRGTTANRSAIGARVRAVAGGASQIREVTAGDGFRSAGSLVVSFGLGAATVVDSVEIWWPGGGHQVLAGVAADQRLAVTEGAASPVGPELPQAAALTLFPGRPNPFNPSTTIAYELPLAGVTRLAVYDLGGRLVRVLVADAAESAGRHDAFWNGRDDAGRAVAAGAYVCRLESGGQVAVERLTLIK